MQSLNIAILQLTSGESVKANVDQALGLLSGLEQKDLDLVCLPENSLYFRVAKARPMPAVALNDPELLRLQEFVDRRNCGMMLGSIPVLENQQIYNGTVFLEPYQRPRVVYRKLHLFDVDVPGTPPVRESESFGYGAQPELLLWRDWKIGLSICYDVRFSELYASYSRQGVDLILIPAAFLVPTGKAHWEILLRARAIENQCFVVAAAQSGEHVAENGDKRHTYGHSLAVGPWGDRLLELIGDRTVGVVRIEKEAIAQVRRQIPMAQHRSQRKWET